MKKTLFTFMALLFVMSEAAHSQSKKAAPKLIGPQPSVLDCKKYHDGTFKTTANGQTTTMKRNGSVETDYIQGSNVPITYMVKWKNDCTYTLTPTPETLKQHPEIKKNTVLTMEIAVQNTNSFTEIVSPNYSKGKINIEVYPVK